MSNLFMQSVYDALLAGTFGFARPPSPVWTSWQIEKGCARVVYMVLASVPCLRFRWDPEALSVVVEPAIDDPASYEDALAEALSSAANRYMPTTVVWDIQLTLDTDMKRCHMSMLQELRKRKAKLEEAMDDGTASPSPTMIALLPVSPYYTLHDLVTDLAGRVTEEVLHHMCARADRIPSILKFTGTDPDQKSKSRAKLLSQLIPHMYEQLRRGAAERHALMVATLTYQRASAREAKDKEKEDVKPVPAGLVLQSIKSVSLGDAGGDGPLIDGVNVSASTNPISASGDGHVPRMADAVTQLKSTLLPAVTRAFDQRSRAYTRGQGVGEVIADKLMALVLHRHTQHAADAGHHPQPQH